MFRKKQKGVPAEAPIAILNGTFKRADLYDGHLVMTDFKSKSHKKAKAEFTIRLDAISSVKLEPPKLMKDGYVHLSVIGGLHDPRQTRWNLQHSENSIQFDKHQRKEANAFVQELTTRLTAQ